MLRCRGVEQDIGEFVRLIFVSPLTVVDSECAGNHPVRAVLSIYGVELSPTSHESGVQTGAVCVCYGIEFGGGQLRICRSIIPLPLGLGILRVLCQVEDSSR